MADERFERVAPGEAELLAVSAALDGEGPALDGPSAAARRFESSALALRRTLRVTSAEPMPDLAGAVLAELGDDGQPRGSRIRRRGVIAAAAAFVIGIASAAAFLLDRDLEPSGTAAADIAAEIVAAQTALARLDAAVSITEHGYHPSVPVRTYTGTLRYRSPEQFALQLDDTTVYPDEDWLPNDVTVVVDEDVAWRSGRSGCPVDSLPRCLGPARGETMAGRAPFSAGLAAPLDLVLPVGGIVDGDVPAERSDDRVRLTTTVAQVRSLVDGVLRTGAFRQVHATDLVVLDLDPSTLVLRRIVIRASDASGRDLWATTWGYDDTSGDVVFELELRGDVEPEPLPIAREPAAIDAGFRDAPAAGLPVPRALPDGFEPYRRGMIERPDGDNIRLASWTDGRAWLTLRAGPRHERGPARAAEVIPVGDGALYLDRPSGSVELFTTELRIVLAGSLPSERLVSIAMSLPVETEQVEPMAVDALPEGALLPARATSLDVTGDVVTVVTSTADGQAVTVTQRPGTLLDPPDKTDVVEVEVGSLPGRYSATLGTLTWVERGWVLEITGAGTGLDDLLDVAATMHRP